MSKLPWLLLLLALAGAGGLAYTIHTSATRGPADYLDAARAHLAETPADIQSALREFGRGIELAERFGDDTLLAELLAERGALLRDRRAYIGAEADFQRLLDNEFHDRAEALRELAEIDLALEDWDAAEAHVDELLAEEPNNGRHLQQRARVRAARFDERWGELRARIEAVLPDTETPTALELAEQIVHLPPSAPRRATRSNRLDALFADVPTRAADEIEQLLHEVSGLAGALRDDLHACLGHGAWSVAAELMLSTLLSADRPEDAVELGAALRRFDGPRANRRFLQLLATALSEVDRGDLAEQTIQAAIPEQGGVWMDRNFLPLWSRILYENESWPRLAWVAVELGKSAAQFPDQGRREQASEYYRGIALANGVNPQAGASSLWRFAAAVPDSGPVDDAIGRAWMTIADLAKDREDWVGYDQALLNCVLRAPDYSGEAWLALARHRLRNNSPLQQPLIYLTHALSMLPQRVDEILPEWEDVGRRSLLEANRDLDLLHSMLVARGEWSDPESSNPYEHFRLAQMHRDVGAEAGALTVCRRLRRDYPNLLPAIDLSVEVYLALDRLDAAVPLLLERLRLEPGDGATLATLRELDLDGELGPDQRLELMRLDPHYTGILVFGRELLESGRVDLAGSALAEADLESLGTPGRFLAAEIALARGEPQQAFLQLNQIEPTDERFATAVRLKVDAAMAMRQTDKIAAVLSNIDRAEVLDADEILAVTRTLLLQGLWEPAELLVERLDELPQVHDGEVVAQLALARMLGRRAEGARDALERLLAFRDDGVAETGELLMAIQERNWTDLPARVRALRATTYEPTPLGHCLMAALEERLVEAAGLAAAGLEAEPNSGRWALALRAIESLRSEPLTELAGLGRAGVGQTQRFLRGQAARPQDPRRALGVLLALEFEEWAVWALADLGNLTADPAGLLWPTYLAAQAYLVLGHDTQAATLLEALTIAFPAFAPAWDDLIGALEERLVRPEHPQILRQRAARAAALGGPAGTGIDARLARALEDEAAGRVDRAVAIVRACLDERPRHLAAQLVLGRLLQTQGKLAEAVSTYGRFIEDASRELAFEYAPAFVEALDFAFENGAIGEAAFVSELQALAGRLPEDPLVALRRARHEIESQRDSLPIGVGRAWLLLDRFRERTAGRPVEALRAGTTAPWVELLVEYDPDRAERFIEDELALRPQSLEHWLLLGSVYEAEGRRAVAATHYQTVRTMVPAPEVLLRSARLQAQLGRSPERVDQLLGLVRRLAGRDVDDPELALIRARTLVNAGGPRVQEGLTILRGLWEQRQAVADRLSLVDLAREFAVACLHHGEPSDRPAARAAMQVVIASNDDPSRVEYLNLLEKCADRIPAAPAPPEPAAAETEDASDVSGPDASASDDAATDDTATDDTATDDAPGAAATGGSESAGDAGSDEL